MKREAGDHIVRALEIVGEAAKNIPMELRETRLDIVWETLKEEIPPLKSEFEKILRDM